MLHTILFQHAVTRIHNSFLTCYLKLKLPGYHVGYLGMGMVMHSAPGPFHKMILHAHQPVRERKHLTLHTRRTGLRADIAVFTQT